MYPRHDFFTLTIRDADTHDGDWKKRKFFKSLKTRKMKLVEFRQCSMKLYQYTLKHTNDLHELHLKRVAAMDILEDIVNRADVHYIDQANVIHLIWATMSCIHHFQLRFRTGSFVTWNRRRKAQHCMKVYVRLLKKFSMDLYQTILLAIIRFYKSGRLWEIEFACTDMVCILITLSGRFEESIELILHAAEESLNQDETEAKQLIQVLYEVLGTLQLKHMSEEMLRRFLVMLRKSIKPDLDQTYDYSSIRTGVNICVRTITRNLRCQHLLLLLTIIVGKVTREFIEDKVLLELGGVLEYAALRYNTATYEESIPNDLLHGIFIMVQSTNKLHNLFGCRTLQNLLDRKNNRLVFNSPTIFFRECGYDIAIQNYKPLDKKYYRQYRDLLHNVFIEAVRHHHMNKMNLETIYSTLAIILVEIPCGYTASSVVCLAMAMQEFALRNSDMEMVASHHIHAIVQSLMSLVCYIHKADVFYEYVSLIMERRSELAPHLNPPLYATYQYSQHYVLWNKPELFFEDWEARYGLWKCFRVRKKRGRRKRKA